MVTVIKKSLGRIIISLVDTAVIHYNNVKFL